MQSVSEIVSRLKLKANSESTSSSDYKCYQCKDTGMIFINIANGEEVPASDVPASQQGRYYSKPCSCAIEKRTLELMNNSGIDPGQYQKKNFSTFVVETEEQKKMKELALEFVQDKEALGFGVYGRSGTGKTHICMAILGELSRKGISHRYFNYRKDIRELVANKFNSDEYNKLMDKWTSTKVLYIDDIFKFVVSNGKTNTEELRIMFEIINARYLNKKITIFSSEFTGRDLLELDEAIGSRIIDITGRYGVKCTGNNYRISRNN